MINLTIGHVTGSIQLTASDAAATIAKYLSEGYRVHAAATPRDHPNELIVVLKRTSDEIVRLHGPRAELYPLINRPHHHLPANLVNSAQQ